MSLFARRGGSGWRRHGVLIWPGQRSSARLKLTYAGRVEWPADEVLVELGEGLGSKQEMNI